VLRGPGSGRSDCDRPLRGADFITPDDADGSASAGWPRDFTAGKLTTKLMLRIADIHSRQWTTLSGCSNFSKADRRRSTGTPRFASTKLPLKYEAVAASPADTAIPLDPPGAKFMHVLSELMPA
jgi:hypothetical protein